MKIMLRTIACSLFILSLVAHAQERIQVSQITDGTFRAQSVRGLNWMNNGQYYSALSQNQVVKYDVRTGEQVEVIVDGNSLDIAIDDYSFRRR